MTSKKSHPFPYVSIIVPVYNDQEHIGLLIESLLNQDYPQKRTEIIIVDNNSRDKTPEIIRKFPVTLLCENDVQSSYAARNRGIKKARGQILAFIDSDCRADPNWLTQGVKKLLDESADLVAGEVAFTFSRKKTLAEMYDSVTNFSFENYVNRGVSGAGNLFVKSQLFQQIGLFPARVKSGGDLQWTQKATNRGFSLVYAPRAIVKHPARPLKPLLAKQFRVGAGHIDIFLRQGQSRARILRNFLGSIKPSTVSSIKKRVEQRGTDDMKNKIYCLWCIGWLCKLAGAAGMIRPLLRLLIQPKPDLTNKQSN
ncbi:glycosyltransferase [Planctomycetota bacterium]